MLAARAWERYCGSASLVSLPHSSKPGVTFFSALAQREREHGLGGRTRVAGGFYADLISGKDRLIEPKDKQLRAAETLVLA